MNNIEAIRMLLGKQLCKEQSFETDIARVEFSVFSQFGDDGIIQYLINRINPKCNYFIEFGVDNYLESNTRFLLQNNNWSGLVMDGAKENIKFIKEQEFYWKHELEAVAAFIDRENINNLLCKAPTEPGLMHIDIDGNDYWIWEAIQVVMPDIVIVEYNSVFGCERAITIPYTKDFVRQNAHYSYLYAGASLPALCDLAQKKGYSFVGSNSAGNNAYFVRKEKLNGLKPLAIEDGYVVSKFRESRDKYGNLNFLKGEERYKEIKGLPVFNTRTQQLEEL